MATGFMLGVATVLVPILILVGIWIFRDNRRLLREQREEEEKIKEEKERADEIWMSRALTSEALGRMQDRISQGGYSRDPEEEGTQYR